MRQRRRQLKRMDFGLVQDLVCERDREPRPIVRRTDRGPKRAADGQYTSHSPATQFPTPAHTAWSNRTLLIGDLRLRSRPESVSTDGGEMIGSGPSWGRTSLVPSAMQSACVRLGCEGTRRLTSDTGGSSAGESSRRILPNRRPSKKAICTGAAVLVPSMGSKWITN